MTIPPLVRLTFFCLLALAIGGVAVAGFSGLLSSYGDGREAVLETADRSFTFPSDEKTLQSLAAHLTAAGQQLNELEPAAGGR